MDFERYKNLLVVLGIVLFIQFGLGMSMNLFVAIPLNSPLNFLGYGGGVAVAVHIVNGILVLGVTIATVNYSFEFEKALMFKLSILGVFLVILAATNGLIFAFMVQNDGFSMGMAISFLTVYTIYFTELYYIGKMQTTQNLATNKNPN